MAAMRLLVVEDDPAMASLLHRALAKQGYSLVMAENGTDALWNALENDFDAVVLDAMIPAPDGFEVCRRMRAAGRWAPVLMLTARDSIGDRVTGLDAGADDYLVKPFALAELHARLRSLTRRDPRERPVQLRCGDLVLDPVSRQVRRGQVLVELSPKEFGLLEELMRHPGEVLTRTHLLEHVWDFAYDGDSNVVDVYVRYLRNKIDRPFGPGQLCRPSAASATACATTRTRTHLATTALTAPPLGSAETAPDRTGRLCDRWCAWPSLVAHQSRACRARGHTGRACAGAGSRLAPGPPRTAGPVAGTDVRSTGWPAMLLLATVGSAGCLGVDPAEALSRAAELGIDPGFGVFVHQMSAGWAETRLWTSLTPTGDGGAAADSQHDPGRPARCSCTTGPSTPWRPVPAPAGPSGCSPWTWTAGRP